MKPETEIKYDDFVAKIDNQQPDYHKLAEQIADLVCEKQKAYGDSFGKCGDFILILYPDGIKPEQYADMLTIVRVFDKLMRIATDKDALGENPWSDVMGYSLLSLGVKA